MREKGGFGSSHVPLALAFAAISWLYPGAECKQCQGVLDEVVKLHEKTELLKQLAIAKQEDLITRADFLELLDKLLPDTQDSARFLPSSAH
jgi:hypothetical protein